MSRLIDADALKIDYGFTWDDITPTHEEMYALIDRQPTIDAVPKGKWIYHEPLDVFECSVCGSQMVRNIFNYCPWCGARMDGEENDGT